MEFNSQVDNKIHLSRVSKESYAEVVKRPSTQNQTAKLKIVEKGDNTDWQKQRKLFFTNMAEDVTMVEIWKTFKQFGQISDINCSDKER